MRLYTRQLVAFAPKPGPAGARVVPDLATAPGRTTDGGRTWTYTLRPGLRWSDGRPLTSADVKYGIERLFASDVITGGPTWAVQLLDDRAAPYDGPYRDKGGLRSIATPDARTITFTLKQPVGDFPYIVSLPTTAPVPPSRDTGPLYVLVGDDDSEKSAVAAEFAEMVDEGLRAFSVDRLFGGDVKADGLFDVAATLPMMAPRRVVIVFDAERLLIPKREGKAADVEQETATIISMIGDVDAVPLVAAGGGSYELSLAPCAKWCYIQGKPRILIQEGTQPQTVWVLRGRLAVRMN